MWINSLSPNHRPAYNCSGFTTCKSHSSKRHSRQSTLKRGTSRRHPVQICLSHKHCSNYQGEGIPPTAVVSPYTLQWAAFQHLIVRAHSFPRQILPNYAAPFAKFRGSPRQIHGIPRPPILEYTVPTLAQLCSKTLALLSHQSLLKKFYT